jgi:hypothetical protein
MQESKIIQKNLSNLKVLIDEIKTSKNPDPYITLETIPDEFGIGKNLVKFKLNSNFLLENSTIDFEAFDRKNERISIEKLSPKDNFFTHITLNIENFHSKGGAVLIVVFSAKRYPNGVLIDNNNLNQYNSRYTYPIYINTDIDNKSEIYFETQPTVSISEVKVTEHNYYDGPPNKSVYSGGVRALQYVYNINSPYVTTNFDIVNYNRRIENNGTITFNTITTTENINGYKFIPITIKIKEIVNSRTVLLEKPVALPGNTIFDNLLISTFQSTNFSLEHYNTLTGSYFNSQSYARIEINDFNPKSGNIKYINIKAKPLHDNTKELEVYSTYRLNETNLLVDKTINYPDNSIGTFDSLDKINTYYTTKPVNYLNPQFNNFTVTSSLAFNNSVKYNTMYLEYGLSASGVHNYDYFELSLKPNYAMQFVAGEYVLQFDYVGTNENYFNAPPNLKVLMSGSAFKSDVGFDGKIIGEINQSDRFLNYGKVSYDFTCYRKGTGILKFLYYTGTGYIRDIKVLPKFNANIVSNYTIMDVPLKLKNINEDILFNLEFVNYQGLVSNTTISGILKSYKGSGTVLKTKENLLYGEMSLSSIMNSGITIGGDKKGSYIMSSNINTRNYKNSGSGFIIFDFLGSSGDDIKNRTFIDQTIPQNVGIDIYATNGNYLRFRESGSRSGIDIDSNAIVKLHRLPINKGSYSGPIDHHATLLSGSELGRILIRVQDTLSGLLGQLQFIPHDGSTGFILSRETINYNQAIGQYSQVTFTQIPKDGFLRYFQPGVGTGNLIFSVEVASPDKII